MPFLLALGIGLSVNNAKAVLEAVFNRPSDFKRTPKYGTMAKSSRAWRSSRYMQLTSFLPIAELLFALYFTYFLVVACVHRQYFSLPFLLLFQVGFSYVALCSLAQWMPSGDAIPEREPSAAAVA